MINRGEKTRPKSNTTASMPAPAAPARRLRRRFLLLALLLAWFGRDGARAQTQPRPEQLKPQQVRGCGTGAALGTRVALAQVRDAGVFRISPDSISILTPDSILTLTRAPGLVVRFFYAEDTLNFIVGDLAELSIQGYGWAAVPYTGILPAAEVGETAVKVDWACGQQS